MTVDSTSLWTAYVLASMAMFTAAGLSFAYHRVRFGAFEAFVTLGMALTWPFWMVYAFALWLTYPPGGRQ